MSRSRVAAGRRGQEPAATVGPRDASPVRHGARAWLAAPGGGAAVTAPQKAPVAGPRPAYEAGGGAGARALLHATAGQPAGRATRPWLLVVAQGQHELARALEALFR